MNNYAPVVIPTLNRHTHFKCCVESLATCTNADRTDLFIFLDYPLKDVHWEGYELIKAYLPNIKGFKTVNIIEREKNYGAINNFFKSLEFIFNKYDRLIFLKMIIFFLPIFCLLSIKVWKFIKKERIFFLYQAINIQLYHQKTMIEMSIFGRDFVPGV